jgi:hypothetical protein
MYISGVGICLYIPSSYDIYNLFKLLYLLRESVNAHS